MRVWLILSFDQPIAIRFTTLRFRITQAALLDTAIVKIVALQAIFDCLLVYGIGAFNDAVDSPASSPEPGEYPIDGRQTTFARRNSATQLS